MLYIVSLRVVGDVQILDLYCGVMGKDSLHLGYMSDLNGLESRCWAVLD